MKNPLKALKRKVVPRPLKEIETEYAQVLSRAAQSQYLVFVHEQETNYHNNELLRLNKEAGERKRLDAESAKQEEAK